MSARDNYFNFSREVTSGNNTYGVYYPKNMSDLPSVTVYFEGDGPDGNFFGPDGAGTSQSDSIIIIPRTRDTSVICSIIEDASSKYSGDFQDVSLYGVSVGGRVVIDTAMEFTSKDYNFNITKMNCFDSTQAYDAATRDVCKQLADHDISLFVNTD